MQTQAGTAAFSNVWFKDAALGAALEATLRSTGYNKGKNG